MSTAYSGDGITFPDNSVQATAPRVGMVNRLINSDMRIDQRNAGAAVTTHGSFVTDRWACAFANGSASGISVQQSSTVPSSAGFINSLVYTVTTGGAVGATGSYGLQQRIEGYNFSDILSGTASAKQFTVSFWVRSSITGTYGMAFRNSARDRSYIATYAVSSANTWEQKAVTVTADTSGTWLTTNGTGLDVFFDLGAGTSGSTTAGSWQAGNYIGLTGGVKLVETSGATFYVTGVQLEKGSTATDFEYVDYSRQLQMCQRYYFLLASGINKQISLATYYNSTYITTSVSLPVTMRTTPSLVQTSGTDYYGVYTNGTLDTFNSFASIADGSNQTVGLNVDTNVSGTSGAGARVKTHNDSAYLAFSAEL